MPQSAVSAHSPVRAFFNKYFIDAFTGMALGLFVTLIAGLIFSQVGMALDMPLLMDLGKLASILMGAGIGVGIAYYLKAPTLVVFACLVAGMMGAHSEALMAGQLFTPQEGAPPTFLAVPGNPIGAYLASVFACRAGSWVQGKTKLDIILVPWAVGLVALAVCAWLNPPVVSLVNSIGLDGLAGGAAVVGCAAHMIGFAVASYKDNGMSGVIAQGLGTSMLQIPNIFKKPIILLPVVIASAVVGPIATTSFGLMSTASGAGMGTAGFVGVFGVLEASAGVLTSTQIWLAIGLLMFVSPAVIAGIVAWLMRRTGWIQDGDMKLP